VRVDAVRIANYGGVRFAELSGLAARSVVTVTGRNGTGKSLFLEAVAQVLTNRGPVESRVGPWRTNYEVLLTVVFDTTELRTAVDWLAARNSPEVSKVGTRAQVGIEGTSNSWRNVGDQWAFSLFADESFRESHPFADLSFLPAVRAVRADRQGTLELESLDPERVRRSRGEGIERALSRGEPLVTPTVSSQLTALDYLDLLAERDGLTGGELDRVVQVFEAATGKRIVPPTAGVGSTSRFEATLSVTSPGVV
jgi:energy-coupling factor transporter ATP-binding protein EcfA2